MNASQFYLRASKGFIRGTALKRAEDNKLLRIWSFFSNDNSLILSYPRSPKSEGPIQSILSVENAKDLPSHTHSKLTRWSLPANLSGGEQRDHVHGFLFSDADQHLPHFPLLFARSDRPEFVWHLHDGYHLFVALEIKADVDRQGFRVASDVIHFVDVDAGKWVRDDLVEKFFACFAGMRNEK